MNREPAHIPYQFYQLPVWRFYVDGEPWLPERFSAFDEYLRRREILDRLDQLGPREILYVITAEVSPLAR